MSKTTYKKAAKAMDMLPDGGALLDSLFAIAEKEGKKTIDRSQFIAAVNAGINRLEAAIKAANNPFFYTDGTNDYCEITVGYTVIIAHSKEECEKIAEDLRARIKELKKLIK